MVQKVCWANLTFTTTPEYHEHMEATHAYMLTSVYPAVAAVLSNWHNVLRAINMASSKLFLAWAGSTTPSNRNSHIAQAER
jgi:hypothetical protein